jgi:putative FmdB family regulatory protein
VPTYDYECGACGKMFEIFHSITETKKKCPECGRSKLNRKIGPGSGFLFRGSGFYITDYRSTDYQSKARSESSAPSKPESKPSETAGDSSSKKKEPAKTA